MDTRARLLAAYDDQLRGEAEAQGAVSVTRRGSLLLATFDGGRGFISCRDLSGAPGQGADPEATARYVGAALGHFQADPTVTQVEWKTRGHDDTPGLIEALLAHSFVPGDPESIMLGEARALAVDVQLPPGVTLRAVTAEADIRAASAMQGEVFGDPPAVADAHAAGVLRQLAAGDELELWVAEADGEILSAGRVEGVRGTAFAGIWGGSTREQWRGRGIYRALTSARARAALAMGKTLINSDSTEYSRPILERAGLLKVSTTTPYVWER